MDPLPLPVTGTVQVTATQPLPVTIVKASGTDGSMVVRPGLCYVFEAQTSLGSREPIWRVETVEGTWAKARAVSSPAPAEHAVLSGWVNLAALVRISDPVACP